MAVVFLSEDAREEFVLELSNCGHNVIKIHKHPKLYTAIESHPDIVVCQIENRLFVEEHTLCDVYKNNPDLKARLSCLDIIDTPRLSNGKYPHDIGLNLAYTGRFAIHNFKHTENELLNFLGSKEIEMIQISQGYSKCSILIVDEDSIITGDTGIYNQVKDKLNCLLVDQGNILLKDMEYGFIGGASGKYKDEIWFYGDIYSHPDYEKIAEFISSRGFRIKGFSGFPLEDIGSIIFTY